MTLIKIQCGCGQRYAFDVEPVQGRMPHVVACPACGADGTSVANEILARSMPVQPATPSPPVNVGRMAVASVAPRGGPKPPGQRSLAPLPGQLDRNQAQHEARAQILWGDAREEVIRFLMRQGVPVADASAIVDELLQERVATIRRNGIIRIVSGGLLICVPIAAWIIFNILGYILVKTLAFTIIGGLYGISLVVKGVGMAFAPKSEAGDVSAD